MLYEIENQLPEKAPLLIVYFTGVTDAGLAGRIAIEQLYAALPSKTLVRFNLDELINYRHAEPGIYVENWMVAKMEEIELTLDLLHDDDGTPILLLTGQEPHLRWEAFSKAIADLATQMGVELAISFKGIPLPLPHTRQPVVHLYTSNEEVAKSQPKWEQGLYFPSSASHYLLYRLQQAGFEIIHFVSSVPIYLRDEPFHPAALALLTNISQLLNIKLPIGNLAEEGKVENYNVPELIAQAPNFTNLVETFETHHDEQIVPALLETPKYPIDLAEFGLNEHEIDSDALVDSIEQYLRRTDEADS
ncbi:PAC2 family protein [Gleimia sp. 6138-11-ORH1]|uniref:PAC2 family protein n=1 Tax=Gleimia sp. 6138-11-ORH1 TaxID=2973937 RepID=UPI002166FA1B|nr:PAC2 family protein [Gleimia sp. 6138-11-ORH1]MCS4484248.1 PAC2 family protein [Gleimia sp. 6138-11-ORH1]